MLLESSNQNVVDLATDGPAASLEGPPCRVVMLSLEKWDDIWRRNQFFCREMVHRGWRVDFVEPGESLLRAVLRGRPAAVEAWDRRPRPVAGATGIVRHRPRRPGLERFASGRAWNRTVARRLLASLLDNCDTQTTILWVNDHRWADVLAANNVLPAIYDITDDWTCNSASRVERERTRRQDEWLCRHAAVTVVCSSELRKRREPMTNSLSLIENGVDASVYATVAEQAGRRHSLHPAPVLGYTGSLHEDRLHVDAVRGLATARPDCRIELIGPIFLSRSSRELLEACPNIRMRGPVAYERLPEAMADFDVLLVPHRVNDFTMSLNPIKRWEYLAAGLPVAATPVSGFLGLGAVIHVSDSDEPDAYLAAVEGALEEAARRRRSEGAAMDRQARRQDLAKSNDWSSRMDQIEQVLGRVQPSRSLGALDV